MKKDVFIMFSLFLQIWVKIGAEVAESGSHHRLLWIGFTCWALCHLGSLVHL